MLGKLLKYDLKWNYKMITIFYVLTVFFAILTRVFLKIGENSTIFHVVGLVCQGITIAMIANVLINSIIRAFVRFITNVYKDESYLTHTLPVEKKTIYLSKVLSSIIIMFTSVLVIIIGIAIMYYSKSNLELMKNLLNVVATMYNSSILKLILVISFVFFLEMVFVIIVGYTGIIIGHKSNDKKILKSIVYSFILFMSTQALTLGIVFLIGVFNSNIMSMFTSSISPDINTIKVIMYAAIAIYLVYISAYYFIGKRQFENGVNVE